MSRAVEANGVGVRFGRVVVLRDFDMRIEQGEIHGLIGPNGAGKTTLVNALTGLAPLFEGQMLLHGEPMPRRPEHVAKAGVARTFQAPSLCPELTAYENVVLAASSRIEAGVLRAGLRTPRARREEGRMIDRADELMDRFEVQAPRDVPIAGLPFGDVRKIEMARALMSEPTVLVLDEPTAGLTAEEVGRVKRLLEDLRARAEGKLTVLLIEHNVPFVFGVSDSVTALDYGRAIASGPPDAVREDPAVVSSYLGDRDLEQMPAPDREDDSPDASRANAAVDKDARLEIRGLKVGYEGTEILHGVDIEVSSGEFVAIFGANGAGKSTLLNSIFGVPRPTAGKVVWNGRDLTGSSPERIVRAGLGLVSQDGNFFSAQSVEDNLRLSVNGLGLSRKEMSKRCEELFEVFPQLGEHRRAAAAILSGGERRMLSIAKALIRRPRLLVLDEPSIGLAPLAVAELQRIVARLEATGLPVLLAEQNAGWVLPLATRMHLLQLGQLQPLDLEEAAGGSEFLIDRYLG